MRVTNDPTCGSIKTLHISKCTHGALVIKAHTPMTHYRLEECLGKKRSHIKYCLTLVWWLWEETHVPKVVSSDPSTVWTFFTLICSKILIVFETAKINEKEAGLAHFKNTVY